MPELPDHIKALVTLLSADPGVGSLVGSRVYGGELEEGVSTDPIKALVVKRSGPGTAIGNAYQDYGDIRVDLFHYAETPEEADLLFRMTYPVLKQLRRQTVEGCLLHWARCSGGPLPLRDPDTDWPYVFTSWQLLVAEVAAA